MKLSYIHDYLEISREKKSLVHTVYNSKYVYMRIWKVFPITIKQYVWLRYSR